MADVIPIESRRLHLPERLTELGLAEHLIRLYGERLRYSYQRGRWYAWDGIRWVLDAGGVIEGLIRDTVLSIYTAAAHVADDDQRQNAVKWAQRAEQFRVQKAALQLARSMPGVPVASDELDADPWLLNLKNGTIDLRTGRLGPHQREHLATKLCPVDYDDAAQCPRWLQFLAEVVPDEDVRWFLQKAIGYSLTGATSEQIFFVLWGSGRNGKTTLFEVFLSLLGDYAIKTPPDTIALRRQTGIPNDIARLDGARLIAAVELEEGLRLAESRVKELVGGDTVTARHMRGEWFDFRPQGKLWLGSNHKPRISGTDLGMWRRVMLIPFTETIEKPDKRLPESLAAELPGILRWAVNGCAAWLDEGLEPPDAVQAATNDYQAAEDVVGNFLSECCAEEVNARVPKGVLFTAYQEWCKPERGLGKRAFGTRLAERYDDDNSGNVREWLGIGLRGEPRPGA